MIPKIVKKQINKSELQIAYKPIWFEGKVAYENIIDNKVYIIQKIDDFYYAVPFPITYKSKIYFNPRTMEVDINHQGFDTQTEEMINRFLSQLFTKYEIHETKKYQIHIKLNSDWKVQKLSIYNCNNYVEDLSFTWIISKFYQALVQDVNIENFVNLQNFDAKKLVC